MDLEAAHAVIFFLDRWCGSSWLSGLSPSEWGGVSLLVAFVFGVLVVAGDGLVVFLVAARGGRRVFHVGVVPPACFVGSVGLSLGLVVEAVGLASSASSVFAGLAPRRLGTLGGVSRCFAGPAVFAAFSELRGTRQVERIAACSFRHLPQVVSHPGG